MNFYVYVYLDPRKHGRYIYDNYCFLYEPFYVGKGKGYRYKDLNSRNYYFKNKINKIKKFDLESIIVKLKEDIKEKDSFILESNLIKLIGRKNTGLGPLVNFTDGGEGCNGYKHTKKTKELISKKRRKNFQDIKKEFENKGYKLLIKENEYKNNKQKLEYIHLKCGNKHSIIWNSFQQGHLCPYCSKKKIDFLEIKEIFESRGYQLLTKEDEYKNNYQKLEYINLKCGKKYFISWKHFQHKK